MVQSGLGDGVILNAEGLLVLGEQGEDTCKGGEGGGQLVLQHVAVLLLQRAAGELPLNELHHWPEIWIRSSHPQDDGVAIAKPDNSLFFLVSGSVPFKKNKKKKPDEGVYVCCFFLPTCF